MNDIKQVLGTAFEAEPPVRIDRTRLIRQGRRRLLIRRMATAGGAAVAVAAVVVSTTVFAGGGQPEQLQPATSVATAPKTTSSADIEQRFTMALAESGIVPAGLTLRAITESGGALQFLQKRDKYEAAADLVDKQGDEGTVYVMVADRTANDAKPTCAPPNTCDQREFGGRPVQLTTAPVGEHGEVLLMAHTKLPDGVQVYAMTSNVSIKAVEQHGKSVSAPTTPKHLVTLEQLGQIVGLAKLKL